MNQPGPGMYEQRSTFANNSGFKFSKSKSPDGRNRNPGPGEYDPNSSVTKYESKGIKIGGEQRNTNPASGSKHGEFHASDHPGPGNYSSDYYDIKNNKSVSYKFPKDEKERGDDLHPGPGHYYIPVHFADVPRYNMPV